MQQINAPLDIDAPTHNPSDNGWLTYDATTKTMQISNCSSGQTLVVDAGRHLVCQDVSVSAPLTLGLDAAILVIVMLIGFLLGRLTHARRALGPHRRAEYDRDDSASAGGLFAAEPDGESDSNGDGGADEDDTSDETRHAE